MWVPTHLSPHGPRYLAIVRALEADIASGRALIGQALAPQRELAYRLGLSVGTVVRAYAVAQQRGLTAAAVGRGTFITDPSGEAAVRHFGDGSTLALDAGDGAIDLSVNVPPLGRQAERLGDALRSLASARELPQLLRYGVHVGAMRHREAIAEWTRHQFGGRFRPDAGQIVVCGGAQQAIWAVCSALVDPGATILSEALTYPGIKSVAGLIGARVHGVEMDPSGLVPEALEDACRATGARVLYLMPTLHNPCATTMPEERRMEVAAVARRHDLVIVEDDVYGFLDASAPAPFAALLGERTCYLSGFSKSIAPGLRLGYCIAPSALMPRIEAAMRAGSWMAPPLMGELLHRWVRDGSLSQIVSERRDDAARRFDIARQMLAADLPALAWHQPCFHLWIATDSPSRARSIVRQARSAGVVLAPPEAVMTAPAGPAGVRICIGSAAGTGLLREALSRLRPALLSPDAAGPDPAGEPHLSTI